MFIPNRIATVQQVVDTNAQGMATYGDPWTAKVAVVRVQPVAQKTSVRADSSASRGAADEVVAAASILFDKARSPKIDDVVEIPGFRLRVIGVEPRHAVTGLLDHFEVRLEHWGEASA